MHSDLVQDFLVALRTAPDDAARSRCMEAMCGAVLGTPGATKELVTIIGTAESDTSEIEPLLSVLEAILDVSRMARENEQSEGIQLLATVEAFLGELAASHTLTPAGRLSLGHAYVGAGLPPPEHLVVGLDDLLNTGDDVGDAPDIDGLIDSLAEEAGADPIAIHTALSGMMATVPVEARAMIVDQIARRPEEFYARVGAYWLLDVDAALRQAAAEGFLQRTQSGKMDAATAERLITLRSWLPDDTARGVLDKVIKEAIRREVAGGAIPKPWKLHRILASIPDGAGAQSIAIAAQSGGQRGIVMLLLKQGFGVKDAYLIPCSSASEQKRFLGTIIEEMAAQTVTQDFVREALAIALGEGTEAGLLPAPGLIDVITVCGLQNLRPEPRSISDMIGGIDPDGTLAAMTAKRRGTLVARSSDWLANYDLLDTWFEDSADLRDALEGAQTPRIQEREIWAFLSTRRAWWARMIARTAMTLHASGDPAWLEFAATALALEDGRDLKKTPIMHWIADGSLDALDSHREPMLDEILDELEPEYLDAPAFLAPEKKNELARLLKTSDVSPDWVDGYVMAIVVSPKMVAPGKWIEPLLGILPDMPDEASLQRYLDIVMLRYNAATETAPNAAEMKTGLDRLSGRALAAWSTGFVTVTKLFKPGWPAKSLNKDDKSVLRLLAETAEDGKDSPLLKSILPTWLERRFDLRK